ncbi:hypothetical protein M5689_022695 [Euphorbia peplus]|nr:hypothetical protein M5689_022695 [Euphorbia peplus]
MKPVFFFSPGNSFPALRGLLLLPFTPRKQNPTRSGVSSRPPTTTIHVILLITGQLNSTGINLPNIINQIIIMPLHLMPRLPGHLSGDLLPPVRRSLRINNQRSLELLVLDARPRR